MGGTSVDPVQLRPHRDVVAKQLELVMNSRRDVAILIVHTPSLILHPPPRKVANRLAILPLRTAHAGRNNAGNFDRGTNAFTICS
jgi:hypothetical protein